MLIIAAGQEAYRDIFPIFVNMKGRLYLDNSRARGRVYLDVFFLSRLSSLLFPLFLDDAM